MRTVFSILMAGAIAIGLSGPASAQTRRTERAPVPDKGMVALTVSTGVTMPNEPILGSGLGFGASVETYITRRVSMRGQLTGASLDVLAHGITGTNSPVALDGNVVYNWEGGRWHPYVTGGVGVYRYKFTENSRVTTDGKVGVDFGGGAEYFLGRRDAVTGEVLLHRMKGLALGHFAVYDPDYWSLSVGYKKYWR